MKLLPGALVGAAVELINNYLPKIIYPHRQDGGVLLFSATAIASFKNFGYSE